MGEYGSKFDWSSNSGFLYGGGLHIDAAYYRSGRDALRALAAVQKKRPSPVLLPALCCQSMVLPFTQQGIEVEFYRIEPDFSADRLDLLAKLRDGAMLIYMRYFGMPSLEDCFLEELKAGYKDLLLVEDRTHDIIVPRQEGGFKPDAMLASVRKWAALPEGGLLVTDMELPSASSDRRFGDMQKQAMESKSRFLRGSASDRPEVYLELFHRSEELLDIDDGARAISPEYLLLIQGIDFDGILVRRRKNVAVLSERLSQARNMGKLGFPSSRPENSTLYFPIFLEERDVAQKELAGQRIYCPVIWPSPELVSGICPVSDYTVAHMLALPCDQRYDERDMELIAEALLKALDKN